MKKYALLKQVFIAAFVLIATTSGLRAQYGIGVTGCYAVATDDLAKGAKNGFGGTLQARYHFNELLAAGIDVSYVMFENKNTDSKVSPLIDGDQLTIIPVTAAFQFYFNDDKLKPFIGLDLGWAYANIKLKTGATNYGILAPQFGVDYQISEELSLQLSAKDNLLIYDRLPGGSDLLTYVGINLGIHYKL